jgi:hypothetical protein
VSLFPEMDDDAEFDAVANALADEFRRYLRQRELSEGMLRQTMLLTHLDDLAGQQTLFDEEP